MRKPPKQKRSREMVEKLLDATAATVAELGLAHTTTNHIAAAAGVSIGSLYQYFPDKEAMIEALLERLGQELSRKFRERAELFDMNQLELRDIASGTIVFGLYLMRTDPLIAELTRSWGRIPVHKALDPLEHLFLVVAQSYFLRKYQEHPVKNLEEKLYVLINSVLFSCLRYVLQESSLIKERDFIRTLTDMIVALLEV